MSSAGGTQGGEMSPLRRALLAIERLEGKVRRLEGERRRPLAVVGMGCRFPAGVDPEAYFQALREGTDAIRPRPPFPRPGWPASQADAPFPFAPAGYLDVDVADFDPSFFGISPREAASIDPQQRLLMEVMWEAFEHAGIDPRGLEGSRTGVFVGMAGNDYAQMQAASERALQLLNSHFASGIGHSMASGRLSYLLGLQGPAVTVDTACSSSLMAIHLACQSLRAGETDMVVAAGTNLILSGDYTLAFQHSRMLSPDGRCKSFAASADGFGRGEGCGVVILKRLDDALRDGDRVLALVRGSAANQDGPSSGLTAPNGPAQVAVIREALAQAGLTPGDVGYVEAHGTGTSLGDPIEAQALGVAFGDRPSHRPLLVGSVKSNMGHLEATAGIAGFIKVVQALRHREIPPNLHFDAPSPHIPWEQLPLAVPSAPTPFEPTGGARRAGVSSFGFSGTNVHVVLEEAPAPGPSELEAPGGGDALPERPLHLLTLSAPTQIGLKQVADRYARHLVDTRDSFPGICHTANAGRADFPHRMAVVAGDGAEARGALEGWNGEAGSGALKVGRAVGPDAPGLAFLYTGQGAQYPGMGWALYQTSPVFRRALEECDAILRSRLEVPLLELLDPSSPHGDQVHRTDYTQPALFALQYALTRMWEGWGIRPDVVLGHSIGEFAAAHAAGVFSLEDALHLVSARGRVMHAVQRPGRMVAVMAPEERVTAWVEGVGGEVAVAAVNAPNQVVVSGAEEAVEAVLAHARAAGMETRALRTSHAFHSPLMDGAVEAFEAVLREVTLTPGRGVRFVSTVTGKVAHPNELAEPGYWASQLRRTVRFADAVRTAAGLADRGVEMGPHPALAGLAAQSELDFAVHPSMHRERDPWTPLLATLGELYITGSAPDWKGFEEGRTRKRVDLPLHPFQRSHLWVDVGTGRRDDQAAAHPLLGPPHPRPGGSREFQRILREDAPAFIGEHRVLGRAILPGTAYLELALAAAGEVLGGPVAIQDLDLLAPMDFGGGARRVHVSVEAEGPTRGRVDIHSVDVASGPSGPWTLHATGTAVVGSDGREPEEMEEMEALRSRCPTRLDPPVFYGGLAARGYHFGPRLQGVEELWVGEDESVARVRIPQACSEDPTGYHVHPLLLDAALQAVGPALGAGDEATYLPVAVERFVVAADPGGSAWVHCVVVGRGSGTRTADVRLLGEDGTVLVRLQGVVFREVSAGDLSSSDPFLHVRWIPETAGVGGAPTRDPELWSRLVGRVTDTLDREGGSEGVEAYDTFLDGLEARAGVYVVRALRSLGWDPAPGTTVELEPLRRELGVVERRAGLLARCLDTLTEEGILEAGDEGWRVVQRIPDPDAPIPPEGTGDDLPGELILLDRCGPHLADGLRGLGDVLELLFPGGDGSVAERMYHDSPPARIFGRSVADAVATALESAPLDRPLRVLEVGAGTAGTARRVVEQVMGGGSPGRPRVEYTFTDISPLFVERARRRFQGVQGMEYRLLDLDHPPEEQGFEPSSYDVVVAANCLHAARDLKRAVAGVGRLLRPGGLLAAVEVFAPHRWFDLTVGLTDGWWHFTDLQLRGRYPAVAPEVWTELLLESGFQEALTLRLAHRSQGGGLASAGQGLVLATRSADARPGVEGAWVVVTDSTGVGEAVAGGLEAAGTPVARVTAQTLEGEEGESHLREVLETRPEWAGILHCGAVWRDRSLAPGPLATRIRKGTGTLLKVARVAAAAPTVQRLCVITRGGQVVDHHDADVDPAAAAAWGLVRTLRLEVPELTSLCLDLDATPEPGDAARVVEWLTSVTQEMERAIRRGEPHVPRLVRGEAGVTEPSPVLPPEYRLGPPTSGTIDDLAFHPGERRLPGTGEVEIRVVASGLNFKDVMNVLGMYPGDPGPLGSECAGVVTAAGAGVELEVGTPVVAAAGHAYGRHVIADASLVAPRPAGLSYAQAATLPVAYLTAHFALSHLGRLRPGDRVLIHAAAGGVGTAACAVAQRAGAEIFATAGSEAKRELLRARGIQHVFDSRSDAFVEGVMQATGGEGVTVVLNSLADDLVDRSFDVLATGGRFLEIGKRGIWTHEQVAALGRDIDYHIIDWGRTHGEDPELVGELFREVMDGVSGGELPPLPATLFRAEAVVDAFRFMAHARHVGKVILTHPVRGGEAALEVDPLGTYLVTGGTSGLGLQTTLWLAEQGATTLVLAARRDPGPEATREIEALRVRGVAVHVRRCDVGSAADVEAMMHWMATLPPLRGIVHSAGALADGTLQKASWEDFEAVLRAKVQGPANLAQHTRGASPDFFVAYSSIASVLGSPGQANHSAANAALDAFAATRWQDGTVGVSLAWGPWSQTGAATRDDTLERTDDLGIGALGTREGLDRLERAFSHPHALLVAMRLDDPARLQARRGGPFLQELSGAESSDEGGSGVVPETAPVATTLPELLQATPVDARRGVLMRRIRERVRSVLGLGVDTPLDPERPLGELGLDSLLAVELRNTLGSDAQRRLPATLLFDHPTVAALTDHLLELLFPEDVVDAGSAGAARERPDPGSGTRTDPASLAAVESLSDDDVDRLLAERLKSRG